MGKDKTKQQSHSSGAPYTSKILRSFTTKPMSTLHSNLPNDHSEDSAMAISGDEDTLLDPYEHELKQPEETESSEQRVLKEKEKRAESHNHPFTAEAWRNYEKKKKNKEIEQQEEPEALEDWTYYANKAKVRLTQPVLDFMTKFASTPHETWTSTEWEVFMFGFAEGQNVSLEQDINKAINEMKAATTTMNSAVTKMVNVSSGIETASMSLSKVVEDMNTMHDDKKSTQESTLKHPLHDVMEKHDAIPWHTYLKYPSIQDNVINFKKEYLHQSTGTVKAALESLKKQADTSIKEKSKGN